MTAQSALIVAVPELDPLVGSLRNQWDPAAREGAPPHITILFPFVDPYRLDKTVLERIRTSVRDVPAFEFSLSAVARFPETLYLAPEPAEPFVQLTLAIARTFPAYSPYGGRFPTVIPHLTVAHGSDEVLEAARLELLESLASAANPRFTCSALSMIENSSGRWVEAHVIPIG